MRVYPDSNIYVSYLLGDAQESLAEEFFRKSLDCLFTIVVSNTTFSEVQRRCCDKSTLLLQKHLEDFEEAGKMVIVKEKTEETEQARKMNEETGKKFGLNDFSHALMAKRSADIFVSNDFEFRNKASQLVRTLSLREFLQEL